MRVCGLDPEETRGWKCREEQTRSILTPPSPRHEKGLAVGSLLDSRGHAAVRSSRSSLPPSKQLKYRRLFKYQLQQVLPFLSLCKTIKFSAARHRFVSQDHHCHLFLHRSPGLIPEESDRHFSSDMDSMEMHGEAGDGHFAALKYGDNTSFQTAEEEIKSLLGEPRDSLTTVVPMTLVYVMILVTGLVGNLCTCFVIVKNRYMHTTVNFYLFSLAVSDLLLLIVGLPTELWAFWQKYPYVFGETFCVLRALISETCSYASILTITAFTVERYIAICHPLKAHTMAQLSRAIKAILFIWVVATLSSIPISLQLGIIYQVIYRSVCFTTIISFFAVDHRQSDLQKQPEAPNSDCTVCPQKLEALRFHDIHRHLLRPAHGSDHVPLLFDRNTVTPKFQDNGSYFERIHFSLRESQDIRPGMRVRVSFWKQRSQPKPVLIGAGETGVAQRPQWEQLSPARCVPTSCRQDAG